jgi:cytochrome c-type biogenesis protein
MANGENHNRLLFAGLALFLFVIFLVGIGWFASLSQFKTEQLSFVVLLAYAAGLTMIVMPCTLPLIFLIVPMTMSKSYKRGFGMALLFGLGLTITITFYGIATAWLGQIVGLGRSQTIIISIAGIAAYLFGLSELGILKFQLPSLNALPTSILQKGDYAKSFLLGLLLGNAGVGCPNPAFYVLLFYIAGSGDAFTGATVGFFHGLGRATPLIMLSILGMLGVNAAQGLVRKAASVANFVAYSLIFLGAYLLTTTIFGIGWWNFEVPNYLAWVTLIGLFIAPLFVKRSINIKHNGTNS